MYRKRYIIVNKWRYLKDIIRIGTPGKMTSWLKEIGYMIRGKID